MTSRTRTRVRRKADPIPFAYSLCEISGLLPERHHPVGVDIGRPQRRLIISNEGVTLKKIVTQRTQMREQIVAKAQQMMAHMREHMSGGMQGMMNCPMMKELAKPADAGHSPHHPEN